MSSRSTRSIICQRDSTLEEVPVSIVSDRCTRHLLNKVGSLVKVSWCNYRDEEATWEREET